MTLSTIVESSVEDEIQISSTSDTYPLTLTEALRMLYHEVIYTLDGPQEPRARPISVSIDGLPGKRSAAAQEAYILSLPDAERTQVLCHLKRIIDRQYCDAETPFELLV